MLLESIWFFLWAILWVVFFITDGFDFGAGILLPYLGRTDDEKRLVYNALGPLWDGNEVWLIAAGGITFAAFPRVYATMFSSLYSALMLILFALILRGITFEMRSKVEDKRWRRLWDRIFTGSSLSVALLFGVAFANIFAGIPIGEGGKYYGSLPGLLNPYGLLGGLLFVVLFSMHGALWIVMKTEDPVSGRAALAAERLWPALLVLSLLFLGASAVFTDLYANYMTHPALLAVLVAAVAGIIGIRVFILKRSYFYAWISSALVITSETFFGIIGIYPNLLPSSIDPRFSLSAHNASSSPLTLKIMLVVVLIFLPIVLAYQVWAYRLFFTKVTLEDLAEEEAY